MAPTITYASLLPVIDDYIRLGNKDILACEAASPGISASFIVTLIRGSFAQYHTVLKYVIVG